MSNDLNRDSAISFRKAEEKDVKNLIDIRLEFLAEANVGELSDEAAGMVKKESEEYFSHAVAQGEFVAWIAEDKGKIVATSGICFYRIPPNRTCPNGKVGYIQNMYTKEEYRSRGIARQLFSKMVDEAKEHGCRKILLNATDMGRPLYESFGFKDTKGDMVYYL